MNSEPRRQAELEEPAAVHPVERAREAELPDCEAEQIRPERHAAAADRPPGATEQRRALSAVPGAAAVEARADVGGEWPVHVARRTGARSQHREAELQVCDEHAAAKQAAERGAVAVETGAALVGGNRVDVVAADERRVA